MSDPVYNITITDIGESRRVVVNGQTYVLLHDAYKMAADARADQGKRVRADERKRIAQAIAYEAQGRAWDAATAEDIADWIARNGGRDE